MMESKLDFLICWEMGPQQFGVIIYLISHRIDVWYIYLHVADFDGKCSIRYSIRGRYGLHNSYHIESTWEKIVYKRHIMLVRLGIASLKVYPKQKPLECAPRHSDTC